VILLKPCFFTLEIILSKSALNKHDGTKQVSYFVIKTNHGAAGIKNQSAFEKILKKKLPTSDDKKSPTSDEERRTETRREALPLRPRADIGRPRDEREARCEQKKVAASRKKSPRAEKSRREQKKVAKSPLFNLYKSSDRRIEVGSSDQGRII
jgi:hypothetical protein